MSCLWNYWTVSIYLRCAVNHYIYEMSGVYHMHDDVIVCHVKKKIDIFHFWTLVFKKKSFNIYKIFVIGLFVFIFHLRQLSRICKIGKKILFLVTNYINSQKCSDSVWSIGCDNPVDPSYWTSNCHIASMMNIFTDRSSEDILEILSPQFWLICSKRKNEFSFSKWFYQEDSLCKIQSQNIMALL